MLSKGAADLGVYQYLTVVWPSHCSSFLLSREPEALCRAAFSLCRHREAEHLATEMAFVSDFFSDGAEAQRLFMSLQSEMLGCWMWRGHPSSLCSPLCFGWCKAFPCCFTVVFLQEILPACHGCLWGRPLFSLCPSILRPAGFFIHTAPLICSVSQLRLLFPAAPGRIESSVSGVRTACCQNTLSENTVIPSLETGL